MYVVAIFHRYFESKSPFFNNFPNNNIGPWNSSEQQLQTTRERERKKDKERERETKREK
jgi:hypothetical protein